MYLSSCNIINPADPVPGYLNVNNINLDAKTGQGSDSAKFSDVWVTVDGITSGVYELPATFPLIYEGNHKVELKAGIILNGVSGTRTAYGVVEPLDTVINFQPGKVITINPTLKYYSTTVFPQIEDFEGNLTFEKTSNSDTTIGFIKGAEAYEGSSGAIYLDDNHVKFECASVDTFSLPTGKPSYVEINYKCDVEFAVGTVANTIYGVEKTPITVVRASPTWKKIYINLSPVVISTYGATGWKIYLYAGKEASQPTAYLYLDNIKVVY